jgi:hypothetical protein
MNRTQLTCFAILALAFGSAVFAAADAPGTASAHKLLGPQAPASASPVKSPRNSTRKLPAAVSKRLMRAQGLIVGIRAPNPARGRPEMIILAFGTRTIQLSVDRSTILRKADGTKASLAALKKGDKVRLSYRLSGKRERAVSITILS